MIEIGLDPSLRLGPIALAWHGIFTAVGILFGVALPIRLLRGRVAEETAYSVATWGVFGGIVGARLMHVLDRWDFYAANPVQILFIWTGGIAVWGAVIGGVLAGYLVARRRGVPIGLAADAAAPGIGLGLAIGRIGDIINGEHHASSCAPPGICVSYTHPETLGQGVVFPASDIGPAGVSRYAPEPVHLAVAYDMAWIALTIALALWLFRRRDRGLAPGLPAGAIFWLWAFLYGAGRFAVSFLRVGEPQSLFALRQDQLIGLGTMLVALPLLLWLSRRGSPAPRPPERAAV